MSTNNDNNFTESAASTRTINEDSQQRTEIPYPHLEERAAEPGYAKYETGGGRGPKDGIARGVDTGAGDLVAGPDAALTDPPVGRSGWKAEESANRAPGSEKFGGPRPGGKV